MEISVQYTNIDSTPSLETYIEKKIGSLLKLIYALDPEQGSELHLDLARTTRHHHKGEVFKASARLKLPKKMFRANHESEDIRTAIDIIKDTLHAALKEYKDTLSPRHTKTPKR